MCRSRRELSNEYLLAKIGVDTDENGPLEVWGKIQFNIHSPPYRQPPPPPCSQAEGPCCWEFQKLRVVEQAEQNQPVGVGFVSDLDYGDTGLRVFSKIVY